MHTRLIVRLALAAAGLATLGACASIPERAWANGRAMSASPDYYRAMNGDLSLATQRNLYSAASPLRLHSEVRWTPPRYYER